MSNVIRFAAPARSAQGPAFAQGQKGIAPLLACFASHRRAEGDAFWLKENAEVLSILAATGQEVSASDLAPYAAFYDGLEARIAFFPQYYRMLLGIAVSLEALGMPGTKSQSIGAWVMREGWLDSEVNDLQRAEARLLLAHAGQGVAPDEGLTDRLMRFASRPATFAIPNQRAAYDLLHVVFYISDYGRTPLDLPDTALKSLHNIGTLAMLEVNADLLAEVCIALRYAGQTPPPAWEETVRTQAAAMRVTPAAQDVSNDAYHNFLVNQWLIATMGGIAFADSYHFGPMTFQAAPIPASALREMSQALFGMGAARAQDWGVMRADCMAQLSAPARRVLAEAEAATDGFDRFFADFARARRAGG